jgi:glycosyltransferase involved in cell wall biosynthesis
VRLTAIVEHADHVCCRYRVAAFRPDLEGAGHHVELRRRPRQLWQWLRLARDLRHTDGVILQRKLLRCWQLRLLRGRGRFLIFDVDDAVFLRSSFSRHGMHRGRCARRFAATVRAADAVVAGNAFLAEQAAQWAEPERVCVIPTCVDPARYRLAEHVRAGQGVKLAWIGSSSSLKALEAARPLLERLGQDVPGLRLKVICDRFPSLSDLPVDACRWSQAGEAAALTAADIGISWLPNDLWSRGKCGLKVLQYMAAGLPVVANPVGVQAEMVRHGETGFLATTPAQWSQAVARLARDPALRGRLGQAGRRLVERQFSRTVGGRQWVHLLERQQATGNRQQASAVCCLSLIACCVLRNRERVEHGVGV